MTHSTRLTLFVSKICRVVKSKFSRDEINSSLRTLIVLNISVHNCCDTPFCLCVQMQFMRQSIPPAPAPPPGLTPGHQHFFLPWMANSRGWGLLSCQIPRGGDEKRGQMPRPPSTLQHFSLIARLNTAVFNIFMCNFLCQLTSSFVIALGFFTPRRHAPVYGFSIAIELLTLKLIERCKVICYKQFYKYERMLFK